MVSEHDQEFRARLELLEARAQITQLEAEYCTRWDSGDASGWAGLFSGDGVFEADQVGTLGGPKSRAAGRQELEAKCAAFAINRRGLHLIGLADIQIDGVSASAKLHFVFRGMERSVDARVYTNFGIYAVTYVKTDDGWRIQHRRERPVSREEVSGFDGFYGYRVPVGPSDDV